MPSHNSDHDVHVKTTPRKRHPFLRLALSLMVTLVIAMPIAFLSTPSLIRWNMSRWLVSTDMQHRQRALNYVAHRADHQPKVLNMAIDALSVPDDIHFQQIFHALDLAGQWRRPPIPNEPWLRWLTILGRDKDPEARIMAIRQTTELSDLASNERLLELFGKWVVDGNELVRYNALIALADLSGHAAEPDQVQTLLGSLTSDPLASIAAEAWLFLGLIDPASGRVANWRQADPAVAAAILWATLRTNPNQPAAGIEALLDPQVTAPLRASAAYALHVNQSYVAQRAMRSVIRTKDITTENDITDENWIAWRAVLSLGALTSAPPPQPAVMTMPALTITAVDSAAETNRPVLWAALYKHAQITSTQNAFTRSTATKLSTSLMPATTVTLSAVLADRLKADRLVSHPVSALALLEGLAQGSTNLGVCPEEAPPYVKLAWTRATMTPSVETLRGLFASDSAPVRDSACVIAWQRFDEATNMQLIASLLRDYNDNAKKSGAILAGLTNLRPTFIERGVATDLLQHKLHNEDIWAVQQIHRVGLWMQGRLPEMDQQIAGLMSRADLPISTLMLAMLHTQPARAMNELFSPLTDPPVFKPESLNARTPVDHNVTLMELLVKYRWLHVLTAMQPKRDMALWLWADTGLQDFQLQIIRNHWLLTRPTAATAWTVDEAAAKASASSGR